MQAEREGNIAPESYQHSVDKQSCLNCKRQADLVPQQTMPILQRPFETGDAGDWLSFAILILALLYVMPLSVGCAEIFAIAKFRFNPFEIK